MTLGVRVVLIEKNRICLVRHTYVAGWHFPGGGIEPGETARNSAVREVLEETGYRIEGPLKLFGVYLNAGVSVRDHVLVFTCREFKEERTFKPGMEIADAGWFDRQELPEGTTEGTKQRLQEIFEGKEPTSLW
ncbi:MAG TPA: NUDIX domain-containing protein [Devosia sp.]|nr:NUDIX domain-containing protein [Devosia sp.]